MVEENMEWHDVLQNDHQRDAYGGVGHRAKHYERPQGAEVELGRRYAVEHDKVRPEKEDAQGCQPN